MRCIQHLKNGNWLLVMMFIRMNIMVGPNNVRFEDLVEFFSILLQKGEEYPEETLDILTLLFSDKWKNLSTKVFASLLQNDTGKIFSHVFVLIFADDFHGKLADFVMSKLEIHDIFDFFCRTYITEFYNRENCWYMKLMEYLRLQLEDTLLECIPQKSIKKSIKKLEKCFHTENSLLIRKTLEPFFKKIMKNDSQIKLIPKIEFIQRVFFGKVVYERPAVIVRLRKIVHLVKRKEIEQLKQYYKLVFLEQLVFPTTTGRYFEFFIKYLLDSVMYEPYQSLVLGILKKLLSSTWGNLTAYYVFKYSKNFSKEISVFSKADFLLLILEDTLRIKRDSNDFERRLSLNEEHKNSLKQEKAKSGKEEAQD